MAVEMDGAPAWCRDHWWTIEGEDWVCSLCGKTEKAQPPSVVDRMESALKMIAAPWPEGIQCTTPESEWWRDRCKMQRGWANKALGD